MDGLSRLRDEARAMTLREAAGGVLAAYERNDLLTYASAIAFQVLFALVPLALFALGLLGGLGLEEVWTDDVAPKIAPDLSPAAFTVVDDTARRVLGERQAFWLTIGLVITVWEMSGAARTVMGVFDRIYCCEHRRSAWERYRASVLLAIACGALVLLAVAAVQLGPALLGGVLADVLRWPVAIAALLAAVGLLVRFAPSEHQPAGWVSFGALLVVVAWVGTSLVFAAYLTHVADYGSIFGALATVIVALTYLYLSSVAFLTGAQVDALVRERLEGHESGHAHRGDGLARVAARQAPGG